MKKTWKRLCTGFLALATVVTALPTTPVHAESKQYWTESAERVGEALQTLRCIISNLEYRFYKAYGMEIEDKRTVYGECTYRLVPREDEPSVCLMHDWIYLPTA